MLQRVIVIALVATLGACASWSRQDIIREAAYDAESGTDMMQTVELTRTCHEENPILGRCGEHVGPYVYLPATAVIHGVISALLPSKQREAWQYLTLGVEGATVAGNAVWLYGEHTIGKVAQ